MRLFFPLFIGVIFLGAVVSAQSDGFVEVPQIGSAGPINTISSSSKNNLIATAGREPRIYVWDANSLTLLRTLDGHEDWVDRIEFMPDGRHLISRSKDGTVRVWDTETGSETLRLGGEGADSLSEFLISPDGQDLYVTSLLGNKIASVLASDGSKNVENSNLDTGLCDPLIFRLFCRSILRRSQVSPRIFRIEGLGYAVVDSDSLQVVDTIQLAEQPFKTAGVYEETETVVSDALMLTNKAGEEFLALAFLDGRIQLRNAKAGDLIWEQDLTEHFQIGDFGLRANLYQFENSDVISVNDEESWVQIKLKDGSPVLNHALNDIPSSRVSQIDENRFAVVIGGKTAISFEAGTPGVYDLGKNKLTLAKSKSALNFDGVAGASGVPYIVAGSGDLGAIRVFDIERKIMVSEHSVLGVRTSEVSISGDGKSVAANGQGSPGAVWDTSTGQLMQVFGDTTYTHYFVQLSDDAEFVAYPAKSNQYRLVVRNVSDADVHGRIQDDTNIDFSVATLSSDAKRVAVGTSDDGIRIYDLEDKDFLKEVPLNALAWTLGSSPHAPIFAAGNHSGEVVVADWEGTELARFAPIQPSHPAQNVSTLDVSNDGKFVVTGDHGGRVCLLSVLDISRNCFFEIGIPVNGVTFAGNDTYIAMVDQATSIYIFSTATLEHILTIEQFTDGGTIRDLRDGSISKFGDETCIEVNGYQWREC